MAGYLALPQSLAPLAWPPSSLGDPSGYPLDLSGAQSYVRPPISQWVDPFPWNWATMGVIPLQPLQATFALPASSIAPMPSSAYLGGNSINVVGGMSFGFPDLSALPKEP